MKYDSEYSSLSITIFIEQSKWSPNKFCILQILEIYLSLLLIHLILSVDLKYFAGNNVFNHHFVLQRIFLSENLVTWEIADGNANVIEEEGVWCKALGQL